MKHHKFISNYLNEENYKTSQTVKLSGNSKGGVNFENISGSSFSLVSVESFRLVLLEKDDIRRSKLEGLVRFVEGSLTEDGFDGESLSPLFVFTESRRLLSAP